MPCHKSTNLSAYGSLSKTRYTAALGTILHTIGFAEAANINA